MDFGILDLWKAMHFSEEQTTFIKKTMESVTRAVN